MRILILGGTGLLGHALWQYFSLSGYDVFVTVRRQKKEYEGHKVFGSDRVVDLVDANNFATLTGVMERMRPDFILNCIGITKRRKEIAMPIPAITLNALLPHRLVAWAKDHEAKVVNFSTDCVFDGEDGNYTEDSVPNAKDLYGKTKALGEISGANALTLRSSFIGLELCDGSELLEWFLSQRGTVKGFKNAIYSGLTTIELGRVVENILKNHPGKTGIYNISSDPISKYDLLLLIKQEMQLITKVVPDKSVCCNRNLDSSKFRKECNYQPPTWETMIKELCGLIKQRRV